MLSLIYFIYVFLAVNALPKREREPPEMGAPARDGFETNDESRA